MPLPPPPRPATVGQEPPPPGRAQRLVARAGFVVYEAGRSIFDEPVLVYLARTSTHWPDFDVVDHVGRVLGHARLQVRRSARLTAGPITLFDPGGHRLLSVRPESKLFRFAYRISGVASADYVMRSLGSSELVIEAGNERLGSVLGRGFRGLSGSHLSLLDHDRRQVGEIRTFVEHRRLLAPVDSFVVRYEPALRGDLRRLSLAAPMVIALIRRARRSTT